MIFLLEDHDLFNPSYMKDEDQNTTEDELFDTSEDEGGSPNVSNTEENTDEKKSDESTKDEENKTLDLEEDAKTAEEKRQQVREEQIKAWHAKIQAGKATLDDIPRHQKWLIEPLRERLNAEKKVEKVAEEYDIDAIVEQKLSAQKDEASFNDMKDTLNDMSLTSEQKSTLNTEYKDFRKDGLSKAKALEKAMKIAQVQLETDRRKYMRVPRAETQKSKPNASDPRVKYPKGSPERLKALNALAES